MHVDNIMGILSDPRTQHIFLAHIAHHQRKLQVFFYALGCFLFICLSYPPFSVVIKTEEPALLGYPELKGGPQDLARFIKLAAVSHNKDEISTWLETELRNLGLAVFHQRSLYSYNITRNVYASIHADRAIGSSALLLHASFRHSTSISMAIALAHILSRSTIWAHDIIFVFSQNEKELQSWLTSYHHGNPQFLKISTGSILAAVSLEFDDTQFNHLELGIHGINGRLPNLDLIACFTKILDSMRVPYHFTCHSDYDTPSLQNIVGFLTCQFVSSFYSLNSRALLGGYRIESLMIKNGRVLHVVLYCSPSFCPLHSTLFERAIYYFLPYGISQVKWISQMFANKVVNNICSSLVGKGCYA